MTSASAIEHPDGLLIDEAAKECFPHLHLAEQQAWKRWRGLGLGASYGILRGKIDDRESHHPFLVAAVEAELALTAACKEEFAKPNWIVTCLVGLDRRPIDGDVVREAEIRLREQCASIGSFGEPIRVTAIRVRRVTKDTPAVPKVPDWMNKERPWKIRIPSLMEAVRNGTLPPGTPAVPDELIKGNFAARGAKAACLRWICEVTGTPLDKSNRPASSTQKAFREFLADPKAE